MGEIQLKEGAETPKQKAPKQKKIWWRVLLAWLGGFIAFPLVLAGAGALVGTVFKTSQVVQMAGGNPEEIIGVEYRDKTILQTVMALLNTKIETLEDINNFTPMVEKMVNETVNPILEENLKITIDWDELKTKKFNGDGEDAIGEYLKNTITEEVRLVNFIDNSGDLKGVFNYFLYDVTRDENGNVIYDEDGNVTINTDAPYSIADFMGGADFLNDVVNYIKVGDVVDIDIDSPKILQTMSTWRIGNINEKIDTLTIGSLFDEEDLEDNSLMNALKDFTISDLSNEETISNLKIGDLIGEVDEDTILYSFRDKTIGEMKEFDINKMYLADILKKNSYTKKDDPSYNKVIAAIMENERKQRFDKAVENDGYTGTYEEWLEVEENAKYLATVSNLTSYSSIQNLKLSDVMDNAGNNKVIQTLFDKNVTVGGMSTAVNDLTIGEIMDIEDGSLLDYDGIKNTKISNTSGLADEIKNTVELSRLVPVTDSSPQILKTLTDYKGTIDGKATYGENGVKIGGVEAKLNTFTLGQVIAIDEVNDSPVLVSLKDKMVFGSGDDSLTHSMNNLKFNQVFKESDCEGSSIMKSLWDNNDEGNFLITDISTAMNNVGLLDVLDDKIYDDKPNKRISYTWWFLLTEETEYESWDSVTREDRVLPTNAAANNYNVSDFDKLVANMEYHMKNEKIDALVAANLIDMDQTTRDKTVSGKRVGDMTLTEFIAYTSTLIS